MITQDENEMLLHLEQEVKSTQFVVNMLTTIGGITAQAQSLSALFALMRGLPHAQRAKLRTLHCRTTRLLKRVRARNDVSPYEQSNVVRSLEHLQTRIAQTLAVSA